eukprot:12817.XXX_781845_783327_1 [CDS] Oithona nana genome sequencing.
MSYYSSTMLDYYSSGAGAAGGAGGASSRYDSIYGSTYNGKTYGSSSSYGGGSSAIDRYYSYLDDISTPSSASMSRSSYLSDSYTPMSSRYTSRYSSSTSDTSGYSSSSSSSSSRYSDYSSSSSSRYSRPIISRAPTYDKYGKELSNYDRWRLSHGEHLDNNNYRSRNYNNNETAAPVSTSTTTSGRSRRVSRIENTEEQPSILNTSRELSVMPGATSGSYVSDLTALPSRFASLTTSGGRSSDTGSSRTGVAVKERGKSMAPSSSYTASFGNTTKSYNSDRGSSSSHKIVHSFPLSVSSKLAGYEVRDVKGDGGCYYRCLSVYFTGTEDNYNKYRREVVGYLREHSDNYSSMIRSEVGYASTSDYFSRKMRTDHQEFAETTEIIATCCVYNINVHVLALVPGKRTWEWLHFDPSIGSGKPSTASRDIYLYNQGSVHFMLCNPK